jgi:adenylate kinase family enzyme
MKLIFIYGPPASGKLTVAEILSKATGVPLFHNHLSRDIVKDIYGDDLDENYELVDKIRFDVFEYCVKHKTDLIFTYVYDGKSDDDDVNNIIKIIEGGGGEVKFVELTAKREDLISRVDNESRKKYKKLLDKKVMAEITKSMKNFTIPYVKSLRVDTSTNNPDESVAIISEKLELI